MRNTIPPWLVRASLGAWAFACCGAGVYFPQSRLFLLGLGLAGVAAFYFADSLGRKQAIGDDKAIIRMACGGLILLLGILVMVVWRPR